MLIHVIFAALTFVTIASSERYEHRKHYDAYEYHGDNYNKYDVNNDGVDDRLDLDRNGKIDKFERKHKYGYGVPHKYSHQDKLDYKPERASSYRKKHDKYEKRDNYNHNNHYDTNKYDYNKKDEKDYYATAQSYKKHTPYKVDAYDKKYSHGKKSTYGKSYHDKKHDGYGSYSGVSYHGKKGAKKYGYDDYKYDNNKPSYYGNKHRSYDHHDRYDNKKDTRKYQKDDYYYGGRKDLGYHSYQKKDYGRYHGNDHDLDGKRYEKYDVTDYDLHPDGRSSKTKTKVYKATSYRRDDKYNKYDRYDRDNKYNRKYPDDHHGYASRDRKHYKKDDRYGYKGY